MPTEETERDLLLKVVDAISDLTDHTKEYMKEERTTHAALTKNLLALSKATLRLEQAIERWNSKEVKLLRWSSLTLLAITGFLLLKLLEWI